jgi:hypothetical protein
MSALERALGLEQGSDNPDAPRETQDRTPAQTPAEIELEGRRYTQAELAAAVRQAQDYTQKTQQLSAQARQLQAQQQALAAALPLIQPEIEALQRRLAEAPRPDPQLRQTDPAAYWDQLATWQDAQIEHQRVLAIQTHQAQAREAAVAQAVGDPAGHHQLGAHAGLHRSGTTRADQREVSGDAVQGQPL